MYSIKSSVTFFGMRQRRSKMSLSFLFLLIQCYKRYNTDPANACFFRELASKLKNFTSISRSFKNVLMSRATGIILEGE